jgi:hypothetical protein
MENFEKLGAFYLGRPFDLSTRTTKPGILLYDSADLVTHAVCVGMTGSGKTGLCIAMLEEAAIDGIPAIVIDPKGDLANLLLTFPDLKPEDFAPWVNAEDARKKGISVEEYAVQQAELWRNGLADWEQDGSRITKLKHSADFSIYTPGSNAGIPVSILKSFAAPPPAVREDNELMTERVNTTVTSLLGLLDIDADPIKSREHILISTILNQKWSQGDDLDIAALIQQIQTPTINRIGVMDLESFYPAKDRFELAMSLNNLLAAPAFGGWMEGEPLDLQNLLHTDEGKPRIAIFSIAHLSDTQRMFFVSLLLNQTLGWMRTQAGTNSLRAILYMDEVFGYFPPVANPPSKLPMLTLLKQGRAFGLGIVLATQNPVDLDYKGLSNAGTWFIGRLQTERDKARVLEGLEGIAAGSGQRFERQQMEEVLAGLTNRVFLLNNVHEDGNEIFQTRWVMSYLRGPLTRTQIRTLMEGRQAGPTARPAPVMTATSISSAAGSMVAGTATATAKKHQAKVHRAVLPAEVPQHFIPLRTNAPRSTLTYKPMLLGIAEVRYSDGKSIDLTRDVTVLTPLSDGPVPVDWTQRQEANLVVKDLEQSPEENAQFFELPSIGTKAKSYDTWRKDFAAWLYRNQRLDLLKSPSLKVASNPDESERDFRIRLQQLAHEQRDRSVEKLRQRYAQKFAALEEKRRRAEQAVERETEQSKSQKLQTAISFGATLLSSFMGRKKATLGTLGRATTAARGVSRSMKEAEDVTRVQETLEAVSQQFLSLEAQFKSETESLEKSVDPQTEQFEKISIKPTKANIAVKLFTLAWAPYSTDEQGNTSPAWQ